MVFEARRKRPTRSQLFLLDLKERKLVQAGRKLTLRNRTYGYVQQTLSFSQISFHIRRCWQIRKLRRWIIVSEFSCILETQIWFRTIVNYPALQALELYVCFENYTVLQTTSEWELAFPGLLQIKINTEVSPLRR